MTPCAPYLPPQSLGGEQGPHRDTGKESTGLISGGEHRARINSVYEHIAPVATLLAPGARVLDKIRVLVDQICEERRDMDAATELRLRAELHVALANAVMDWEEDLCPGDPVIARHLSAPENRPVGFKLTRWAGADDDADPATPFSRTIRKPIIAQKRAPVTKGKPYRCRCCGGEFQDKAALDAHWGAA